MTPLEIMKCPMAYVSGYENTPVKEQQRAKRLCWEYNRTAPDEQEKVSVSASTHFPQPPGKFTM